MRWPAMVVAGCLWLWASLSSAASQIDIYPGDPVNENDDGVRWMLMPDGSEQPAVAIISGLEPRNMQGVETIKFYLYTRENPTIPEESDWNTSCLPVFKYFKPERPTKILIHGFGDSWSTSLMYPALRSAYLKKADVNVLEVDWSEMAAVPWYLTAARNTEQAGVVVAEMLDHLVASTGAKADDLHAVGFSLGGHVAGAAGHHLKAGPMGRITGLDPAQVLFGSATADLRLDPSDARLVEVVHTSAGYLGFGAPIGHRDFFPNGGSWPQPGCVLDYAAVCSHRRAYYYYAEDIVSGAGFMGTLCDTYPHYETGVCERSGRDTNMLTLEMVNENNDPTIVGKFFMDTNPEEPYGKTKKRRGVHWP